MSQNNEISPQLDSMSQPEFDAMLLANERARRDSGLRSGPSYSDGEGAPLVWYGNAFERGLSPAGTVACTNAVRCGGHQGGLDVMLVGSHTNSGNISIPHQASITMTLQHCDHFDGTYVDAGPSICVTAPAGGIAVEPDGLAVRFPLPSFKTGWIKVKLVFSGAITGGKLDCVLGYIPR